MTPSPRINIAGDRVSCWEVSYLVDCGRLVLPLQIEKFEGRIEYDSS